MRELQQQQSHRPIYTGLAAATLFASAALAQTADVGLSSVGAQRFGQPDLPNPSATGGDQFGWAFAAGDFDGDGAEDLATGAYANDGPSGAPVNACGAVVVRYGVVGKGLDDVAAPTVLGQFVGGGFAEANDAFGYALTACNLNGDAYDDLVVGVPGESVAYGLNLTALNVGLVEVYYGTSSGIVPPASTTRHERSDTLNVPQPESRFGWALACADFNDDDFDDLAVGVPLRELTSATNAGRVDVYAGSKTGISLSPLKLDQSTSGIESSPATGEHFGEVLAAGDFNNDGFADLAIGVSGEQPGDEEDGSGAVHVVYGSETGLANSADQLLFESSFGRQDGFDGFGSALAVGNFDADAYDDLAIGIPRDDHFLDDDAGAILEVFGSAIGLDATQFESFDQSQILGGGEAAGDEQFGFALAAGDFDADGADDLAVGSPREDAEDGGVTIVMGLAGTGLEPAPNRRRELRHGLEGVPGNALEELVRFGEELGSGDFDGDGHADVAIGAPNESEVNLPAVGTVTVLYGALFADGFGSGGTAYWSEVVP